MFQKITSQLDLTKLDLDVSLSKIKSKIKLPQVSMKVNLADAANKLKRKNPNENVMENEHSQPSSVKSEIQEFPKSENKLKLPEFVTEYLLPDFSSEIYVLKNDEKSDLIENAENRLKGKVQYTKENNSIESHFPQVYLLETKSLFEKFNHYGNIQLKATDMDYMVKIEVKKTTLEARFQQVALALFLISSLICILTGAIWLMANCVIMLMMWGAIVSNFNKKDQEKIKSVFTESA